MIYKKKNAHPHNTTSLRCKILNDEEPLYLTKHSHTKATKKKARRTKKKKSRMRAAFLCSLLPLTAGFSLSPPSSRPTRWNPAEPLVLEGESRVIVARYTYSSRSPSRIRVRNKPGSAQAAADGFPMRPRRDRVSHDKCR